MTSLEQAEALANKLGFEPESADDDYLEIIQKHMEAFARENADDRLIEKNFRLMMEVSQLKEQNRELLLALKEAWCLGLWKDGRQNDRLEDRIENLIRANDSELKALDKAALAKERTE